MKALKTFKSLFFVLLVIGVSLFAFIEKQPSGINENTAVTGDTAYVIQLRKNTNPRVIEAAKKPLLSKYPDKTLLTQVQPPNYILSIGYFSTAAEAETFKKEKNLEKDFAGCAVVPVEKKK